MHFKHALYPPHQMNKGEKLWDHLTGYRNAVEKSQDPFVRRAIIIILFSNTRVGEVL